MRAGGKPYDAGPGRGEARQGEASGGPSRECILNELWFRTLLLHRYSLKTKQDLEDGAEQRVRDLIHHVANHFSEGAMNIGVSGWQICSSVRGL